jgi:DNA modification methylase
MEVKYVQIRKLRFSEYNPRALTEKEFNDLKESLVRFGFVEPIVVNSAPGRENVIIGGHQRVRVAEKIGIQEIPVVYVNIPDLKKEQELNLRLNKNLGHWDYDLLANFDENLLQDVGFETEELDEIFGLDIDDEFDVEKELEKVLKDKAKRVKNGDIWQLGEHKLIIGDATKQENWKKVLGNERFDFLFTDPPYKLAYTQRARKIKTKEGMKLKKDKIYESVGKTNSKGRFKGWVKTKKGFGYRSQRSYLGVERKGGVPEYDEWLSIANEFQNPKGANVMVFENWKNTVPLWQAIEKYWKIRNMIIWWLPNRHQGFSREYLFFNKYDIAPLTGEGVLNEEYEEELDNYLRERGQKLLDTYEIILYGQHGKSYWDRRKGSKWAKVSDHITWTAETEKSSGQNIIFGTKPIQILVPYIKILSPRNGIVMDCFAGSGSTIIACEIMKRKCRAIEIEPIYGEVILARFERFTGQKAIKIEGS